MNKIAFIIDGGYFFKKYKKIFKKYPNADKTEEYVLQIFKYLEKDLNRSNVEIYRIYYYDSPPFDPNQKEQDQQHNNLEQIKLDKVRAYFSKRLKEIKRFHNHLRKKNFFALRMGTLQFQGWKKIDKNRIQPSLKQKGVDMRMGLDIASMTTKKLCSKLVLISGDTDITPAMKLARKEGVHVYWHSMDDGKIGTNLSLATHCDVIIKTKPIIKELIQK